MTEQSAPSFKLWWLSINTIRIVILCSSSPSRVCASLFITIIGFCWYGSPIGLVYSIHDSTEVAIQKMIGASQRIIATHSQVQRGARTKKGHVIGQYGLYLATNGLREQVIYCLKYSKNSYSYQHSNFIDFRFRYSEWHICLLFCMATITTILSAFF